MKITTTILAACMCVALVSSVPLQGYQSQALDKMMASETRSQLSLMRNKRTIGVLRELFPDISKQYQDANAEASETNQVVSEPDTAQGESRNNAVSVTFDDETVATNDAQAQADGELAPLDDIEAGNDDDNRNKRFLNFGFGASGGNGGAGGGSGGGSGNFLFDIIRQAADSAARAAGTVYRVVAGTQSLGLGLSASRDLGPAPAGGAPMMMPPPGASPPPGGANNTMKPPLVAGSGSGSSGSGSSGSGGDPADGAPTPGPQTEAVPGPVTRLFVIANRGISNLIQDLILRLAATSERIVNFKARLITSII